MLFSHRDALTSISKMEKIVSAWELLKLAEGSILGR